MGSQAKGHNSNRLTDVQCLHGKSTIHNEPSGVRLL